jgi:trehalose utilization protein
MQVCSDCLHASDAVLRLTRLSGIAGNHDGVWYIRRDIGVFVYWKPIAQRHSSHHRAAVQQLIQNCVQWYMHIDIDIEAQRPALRPYIAFRATHLQLGRVYDE